MASTAKSPPLTPKLMGLSTSYMASRTRTEGLSRARSAGPAFRSCGFSRPRGILARPKWEIPTGARQKAASRWKSRKAVERALRYFPLDNARHDKMVKLVDRMLELNKQKHSVPQSGIAPSQVERVDREIAAPNAEIDEVVYKLYGISEDERRIIEGA
jgi:hypothetical protein